MTSTLEQCFKVDESQEGLVTLTFDVPGEKMNTFSMQALTELEEIIQLLAQKKRHQSVVDTQR